VAAGWSIEAKVFGEEIVNRRLLRFAAATVDASDAFRTIVGILRDATEQNFETRGMAGGSRWRDLSAKYAKRTGRRVDERILRLTDRLYLSLVGGNSGDHVEEIGPTQMRWGSSVPYGVFHQSSAPRSKIPYRPPVRLSQRRRQEVVKALQRAVVEQGR
jgi:phage gpG-like protein